MDALVSLAGVAGLLAALIAFETIRYAEARAEERHHLREQTPHRSPRLHVKSEPRRDDQLILSVERDAMSRNGPMIVALMVLAMVGSACSGGGDSDTRSGAHSASDADGTSTTSSSQPTTPTPKVLPAVEPRGTTIAATLRTPDSRDRTYHVYVPSTLATDGSANAPVPLLVALHGGLGWGTQFERTSGFDGLAEANRFIVVYPDGIGVGPNAVGKTWNGGRCCGPAVRQGIDDVTFIRMLIEHLRTQHPIDPARIFATGHSNGGILAYRLACELADTIVAVGVQSASLEIDGCQPARPVSLLHIHGTADQNIPINGGTGPNAVSGVSFRLPRLGAKTIAALDGCPAEPLRSTDPTNSDVSTETWRPCSDGTEVRFMTVDGAPHAWMGAPANARRRGVASYPGLDSSAVIWQFLIAHPRTS